MTNIAYELGNQVQEELHTSDEINLISYDSLLIMGMGGSGVSGDVLKLLSNLASSTEVNVVKNYSIPSHLISKKPFCLFISYSGNTEETISGLNEALKNGFEFAVISSGGKLIELAKDNNKQYIQIPSGLQPRAAFGYLAQAVCIFLDNNEKTDYTSQLKESGVYLNNLLKDAEKSEIENLANAFAEDIKNKTCVIYGGTGLTELVSSRWKTQINENSKAKAFIGSMPEVHHNEILSWQADEDGTRENFIIIFSVLSIYIYFAQIFDLFEPLRNRSNTSVYSNSLQTTFWPEASHRALGTFREPSYLVSYFLPLIYLRIKSLNKLSFTTLILCSAIIGLAKSDFSLVFCAFLLLIEII